MIAMEDNQHQYWPFAVLPPDEQTDLHRQEIRFLEAAYQAGYNRGYGETRGNGRWDRDRNRAASGGYYGNGGYGNGGYGNGGYGYGRGNNPAQQVGYQDGVTDGSQDRQTGHSFRPTQQQAYKHADHNYSPSYGDRQQYKDAYRVAYQQGYQQGYNGGGYRR